VRFSYDRFLFKHISKYLRTLSKDNNTVTFELIENELHKSILPKVLASKGYYKIKSHEQKATIEYFQEVVLENNYINRFYQFYLYFVKNEALKFAIDLQQYAQICSL